jgi:hypothetical protein
LTLGGRWSGGCGFADIARRCEFARAKAAEPPPLETPAERQAIAQRKAGRRLHGYLASLHVRVSQPLHDPRGGLTWRAASGGGDAVTGRPLGTQTYRIFIAEGVIFVAVSKVMTPARRELRTDLRLIRGYPQGTSRKPEKPGTIGVARLCHARATGLGGGEEL